MDRPITPTLHGVADYATVMTTAAAPHLFDFSPAATRTCAGLAAGYLGLSALTDYRLSLKDVVPFKMHGVIEAVSGAMLPALPWVFGFADDRRGRNYLLALTALTFAIAALTDWDDS